MRARNAQKLKSYMTISRTTEAYLVNYEEREQQNKPYTSQVAETHIDSIINERYKSKKMQWTREGAHNVTN